MGCVSLDHKGARGSGSFDAIGKRLDDHRCLVLGQELLPGSPADPAPTADDDVIGERAYLILHAPPPPNLTQVDYVLERCHRSVKGGAEAHSDHRKSPNLA